jgi:hypothetical protein
VVVCGDGEYIIYTAMALRNKAFGPAQEFVWAQDSSGSEYAIRENSASIKLFKNFKERRVFKPEFGAEGIYGGFLLGVKSISGLAFYDWETTELIRRIEISPRAVYWSENGELVAIATDDSYFVLKYNEGAVGRARETKDRISEDGYDDAFDVRSPSSRDPSPKTPLNPSSSSLGRGGDRRGREDGDLGRGLLHLHKRPQQAQLLRRRRNRHRLTSRQVTQHTRQPFFIQRETGLEQSQKEYSSSKERPSEFSKSKIRFKCLEKDPLL